MVIKEEIPSIWPRTVSLSFIPALGRVEKIEEWFEFNFKEGYPVLVSSGRAAIGLIARYVKDLATIQLFPYASQCVVNAFILNGVTPFSGLFTNTAPRIIYHQWGYKSESSGSALFIEDSVDSFFPIGSAVRRADARFEIWSLTKILGLRVGAVLWCKNESDAIALRLLVKNYSNLSTMKKSSLRALNRSRLLTSNVLWEKAECRNPKITPWEAGHIMHWIIFWDKFYNSRQNAIQEILAIDDIKSCILASEKFELGNSLNMLPAVLKLDVNKFTNTRSSRGLTYRFKELHVIENSETGNTSKLVLALPLNKEIIDSLKNFVKND